MKNKYKIGDKVKFINCDDRTIPSYHYENNSNIPDEYIKHGSIGFKINEGEIIHIYDKYYIVRYIDEYNKQVQLGFKEEDLELLNNNINKELTSLPEKWSLIIDNIEDIKPYLLKKYGKIDSWFNDISCKFRLFSNETGYIPPSYISTNLNLLDGYTEITLEQFMKWVIVKEEVSSKFEVGKWYKFNYDFNGRNITIYGKCKNHTNNLFNCDDGWYINSNKEISHANILLNHNNLKIKLLTDLSEIQAFLPDGHKDSEKYLP